MNLRIPLLSIAVLLLSVIGAQAAAELTLTYANFPPATADIGNFAMSYQPGRFPVSEAVDLYHGFTSATVASQVRFDLVEKYKPKEFEKVKLITLFTCPPTNFMTKTP